MVATRPKSSQMPLMGRTASRVSPRAGYDAIDTKNRRQAPTGILRSEDNELLPEHRRKLVSGVRDIRRNFALVAWAIRKHLDYVTNFTFRADTGDEVLDDEINQIIEIASRKENFDAAGRHSRARMTRIAEGMRVVDGDFGFLKIRNGSVQGIEGDRIRTPYGGLPDGVSADEFTHGIQLGAGGRARAYAISKRVGQTGFEFERIIPAYAMYLHAFYDRIDQVRGISPVAASLNNYRDVYEGFDYALAKMKVTQIFALATFMADDPDELGETTDTDVTDEDTGETGSEFKIDFGKGPIHLPLRKGDDAKFLSENTPSSEFQAFSQIVISVALKSLDIPYSFYAENFTNYSGSRQAVVQYEHSASTKREDVRDWLNNWTAWRLSIAMDDGILRLPGRMRFGDLKWKWIARGLPWIDPLKEINGDVTALQACLNSPQRILERQGVDAWEVLREIAQWNRWRVENGLPPYNFDSVDPMARAAAVAAAEGQPEGKSNAA